VDLTPRDGAQGDASSATKRRWAPIIVVVLALNIFAVSIYGEAEFIFASVKIVTIVGLLLVALVIDLGGAPKQGRLGFRYWVVPDAGGMKEYIAKGDTGRFLGLFATLINATFSYGGVEMVAVAAGEAENPRKNIPKAVRRQPTPSCSAVPATCLLWLRTARPPRSSSSVPRAVCHITPFCSPHRFLCSPT